MLNLINLPFFAHEFINPPNNKKMQYDILIVDHIHVQGIAIIGFNFYYFLPEEKKITD